MSDLIFRPIMPAINILLIIMLIVVLINRKHVINRILIIALIFIINQRPMLRNRVDITYSLDLDVAFVIDTTVSMNATDVPSGMRLDEAKAICKKIMNALPGSQFEVITFDNEARMRYPFTDDNAAVENVIDSLSIINPAYSVGSALTMPIEFLHMSLSSQEEHSDYHKEKRQNIIFIIGDGELNNEEKLNTDFNKYTELASMIDNGAIIGIGTKEGGTIRILDENKNPLYMGQSDKQIAEQNESKAMFGEERVENMGKSFSDDWYVSSYIKKVVDANGYLKVSNLSKELVISKYDEDNIKELASKLNLDYFNSTDNKLDTKLEKIKENAISNDDDKQKKDQDIYYYFSIPLLILVIYELYYYRRIAN